MRQARRRVPPAAVHRAAPPRQATQGHTGQVKTRTYTTNLRATGPNRSAHPTG